MKLTDALGFMAVPALGGIAFVIYGIYRYEDFYAELETIPTDVVSNVITPVGMIAIGTVILAASVITTLAMWIITNTDHQAGDV